jgi:hypothetical protein
MVSCNYRTPKPLLINRMVAFRRDAVLSQIAEIPMLSLKGQSFGLFKSSKITLAME